MEEQYEAIDKIINRVMAPYGNIGGVSMLELLREVAIAALEHGYASGYETGFDDGSHIGFPEAKVD